MGIQRQVILEDEQINDEEYVAFVNVTALTHLVPIHLRHSEASIIICHGTSTFIQALNQSFVMP